MTPREKYSFLKGKIEICIKEFIDACEKNNLNWQCELNIVLADGQKAAGIKDVRQLV